MNQTEKTLKLSAASTGIREASTDEIVIKGVKEKCVNITLLIESHLNKLTINYEKIFLNSENEVISTVKQKPLIIKDIPEFGTIELDENYLEKPETYEKVKDEDLVVTEWDALLGEVVINAMKEFVSKTEGYI